MASRADTQTHIHTHTDTQTKAISRNQPKATHAWFKNHWQPYVVNGIWLLWSCIQQYYSCTSVAVIYTYICRFQSVRWFYCFSIYKYVLLYLVIHTSCLYGLYKPYKAVTALFRYCIMHIWVISVVRFFRYLLIGKRLSTIVIYLHQRLCLSA